MTVSLKAQNPESGPDGQVEEPPLPSGPPAPVDEPPNAGEPPADDPPSSPDEVDPPITDPRLPGQPGSKQAD